MIAPVRYTTDVAGVAEEQLVGFFVGWPRAPSTAQHLAVLRGSYRAVVARPADDERVIGFVAMISDGVLTAFIPWLEVLPEYQGRGIGTELVRRVLVGTEHLYSVDLLCDEPLRDYYRRFDMVPVPGMTRHNRAALHG